jgi:hypothetical protein
MTLAARKSQTAPAGVRQLTADCELEVSMFDSVTDALLDEP